MALRLHVLAILAALMFGVVPNASAIVGGTPSSGADTPVVFVGQVGAPRNACTGVAVSPTLVLTAAHCGLVANGTAPAGQPFVVFKGPSVAAPTLRTAGVFFAHPDFRWLGHGVPHFADADLAVITITGAPLPGPYAQLPALGTADVKGSATIYGYGVAALVGGHADPASFGRLRYAEAQLLGVKNSDPEFLHFNGPACFGDSGGPVLRGGTVLAIISFAPSACKSTNYATRLDTVSARLFLSSFGL